YTYVQNNPIILLDRRGRRAVPFSFDAQDEQALNVGKDGPLHASSTADGLSRKQHWIEMAKSKIGVTPGNFHANVLQMNTEITRAYTQMYLADPQTFKWAGMAAFASAEVGRGMVKSLNAFDFQTLSLPGGVYLPHLNDFYGINLFRNLVRGNAMV